MCQLHERELGVCKGYPLHASTKWSSPNQDVKPYASRMLTQATTRLNEWIQPTRDFVDHPLRVILLHTWPCHLAWKMVAPSTRGACKRFLGPNRQESQGVRRWHRGDIQAKQEILSPTWRKPSLIRERIASNLTLRKCIFRVPKDKLLYFIVSECSIKANMEFLAVKNMGPITNLKGMQKLTRCLASLGRFISHLGEWGIAKNRYNSRLFEC